MSINTNEITIEVDGLGQVKCVDGEAWRYGATNAGYGAISKARKAFPNLGVASQPTTGWSVEDAPPPCGSVYVHISSKDTGECDPPSIQLYPSDEGEGKWVAQGGVGIHTAEGVAAFLG